MRAAHTASPLGSKARVTLIGACAVLVALIATAFAVGGSGSGRESGGPASGGAAATLVAPGVASDAPYPADADGGLAAVHGASPEAVTVPKEANGFALRSATGAGSGAVGGAARAPDSATSDSSVDATKIVRTGALTVRVAKSRVQATVGQLTALATAQGGYVSSSQSNLGSGDPYGEVVLRVPVDHFDDVIAAASKLGRVLSLTTSADDVTGHYVDLAAKMHALEKTRATYLTILSRARSIGATLAVQQRIDDVQQQIDQLHGQLKVLSKQAAYSTLTVEVTPAGLAALAVHHERHGIGKAWHDSWSRFGRGVNAIVGAIGPIVFAVLLIGLLAGVGALGYRGVRRVMGSRGATT